MFKVYGFSYRKNTTSPAPYFIKGSVYNYANELEDAILCFLKVIDLETDKEKLTQSYKALFAKRKKSLNVKKNAVSFKFDSIQNLDMRMFFPQELDSYLKWNGFNIIHKYGGFKEEEFKDKSEKQIFVCKVDSGALSRE